MAPDAASSAAPEAAAGGRSAESRRTSGAATRANGDVEGPALGRAGSRRASALQQRLQRRPDVGEHRRMRLGERMDAGRPGTASHRARRRRPSAGRAPAPRLRLRDLGEHAPRIVGVFAAIVRRQLHADDHAPWRRRLGGTRHRDEVVVRVASGRPRSASLPPSSRMTTAGLCCASRAGRRVRPPAVVSPLMLALTTRRRSLAAPTAAPSARPSLAACQAVFGREAVAHHEDHRRAAGRAARAARRQPSTATRRAVKCPSHARASIPPRHHIVHHV